MKKTIMINGMMCDHCRMHVEKALSAVSGVSAVDVSLKDKKATVTLLGDVADNVLADAVNDAGYEATKVTQE
jgi:copper ion binding protein